MTLWAGLAALALSASVVPPPVNLPVDYQLSGAYPLPPGVRIVSRDWRQPPPRRGYGICYINAYQSQPEMFRWWRRHHARLLLRDRAGRLVGDRNWPGEYLFDIATPARRHVLLRVVDRWLDRCAGAGYAAVEPDNLDSWTRSRGLLTRRHAALLAQAIVRHGHARGLAVAQKNAVELGHRRGRIGFDFAVVEDCQVYRECGAYLRWYGRSVIEIEYSDLAGRRGFRAACRQRGTLISIAYRDRQLLRPGHRGYRFATC